MDDMRIHAAPCNPGLTCGTMQPAQVMPTTKHASLWARKSYPHASSPVALGPPAAALAWP